MNLYQIHGLFQVIAFIILFPLGAAIAYFRNSIGSIWRPLHIGIQLLAIAFVFIAYAIVKYANSKKKSQSDKSYEEKSINQIHKGLGYTVLVFIVLQLIWAFFGKLIVPWMTWYYIHMTLSALIILSGITNIIIAGIMIKS